MKQKTMKSSPGIPYQISVMLSLAYGVSSPALVCYYSLGPHPLMEPPLCSCLRLHSLLPHPGNFPTSLWGSSPFTWVKQNLHFLARFPPRSPGSLGLCVLFIPSQTLSHRAQRRCSASVYPEAVAVVGGFSPSTLHLALGT